MYLLPPSLAEDIKNYESLVNDFLDQKIEPIKFKAVRVPMGIYEQRKDGTFMVRVRCAGGFISPKQLKDVADIAVKYGSSLLHVTTRQEIQIQNVSLPDTVNILKDLYQVNLASRGGGGNTVRNIMASIDSGIDPEEVFDIFPHVVALTNKLIAESDSWLLPRKFKIAFSNSEQDTAYAAFNDLGFVAKIQDGVKGFKVFVGGSLGSKPMLSPVLSDFVPEDEMGVVADAVKKLFSRYGNRKNKHKARLRYIFYKHGKEHVFELFRQIYEEVKADDSNKVQIPELVFTNQKHFPPIEISADPNFEIWKSRYAKEQKQNDLFSVIVPLYHGNISTDQTRTLAEFISGFGEDVIRFSMRQNIHLRNIPAPYLGNIYNHLKTHGYLADEPLILNSMVSCTGADTCRLGICLSKGALSKLYSELKKSKLNLDELNDIKINISGCPNSCGQQTAADLGFYGIIKRNDHMFPAYKVVAGAIQSEYHAKIADQVGEISARDLPQFTTQLFERYLSKRHQYANFAAYISSDGKTDIAELCQHFEEIPSFEDDKNYYFDWGSDSIFSLVGRGLGECSAGLFDLIDLDMNSIIQSKEKIATSSRPEEINSLLYRIIYSSARMLLITRGIEPKNETGVFTSFIDKFIGEKLVNEKYKSLILKAQDDSGDDFTSDKDLIYALSADVIELYENMDDSLQFKNIETNMETSVKPNAASKQKDLRGVKCPMNFVKTKIELATLNQNDLLEILLDDGEPIENVPGSVKSEGHSIVSQIRIDNYWSVLIQKR